MVFGLDANELGQTRDRCIEHNSTAHSRIIHITSADKQNEMCPVKTSGTMTGLHLAPMLPRMGWLPADADGAYAFEFKWDGVRTLAYVEDGAVELRNRNGHAVTHQYPELKALQVNGARAVLDGEIVALNERGRPDFELLQRRLASDALGTIARNMRAVPITYMIFDVLFLDAPLLDRPYLQRRDLLERLELHGSHWCTPRHTSGLAKRCSRLAWCMAWRGSSPSALTALTSPENAVPIG